MKRETNISVKNWEILRANIQHIITENKIALTDFKPVGIHENWQAIEKRIYATFCNIDRKSQPIWLWEHFKLDTFQLVIEQPVLYLNSIIENDEKVWFFINGNKGKLWFYEGNIKAITTILNESSHIDEAYIGSKKYSWLICINHHDSLIATGRIMSDKLRQLSKH